MRRSSAAGSSRSSASAPCRPRQRRQDVGHHPPDRTARHAPPGAPGPVRSGQARGDRRGGELGRRAAPRRAPPTRARAPRAPRSHAPLPDEPVHPPGGEHLEAEPDHETRASDVRRHQDPDGRGVGGAREHEVHERRRADHDRRHPRLGREGPGLAAGRGVGTERGGQTFQRRRGRAADARHHRQGPRGDRDIGDRPLGAPCRQGFLERRAEREARHDAAEVAGQRAGTAGEGRERVRHGPAGAQVGDDVVEDAREGAGGGPVVPARSPEQRHRTGDDGRDHRGQHQDGCHHEREPGRGGDAAEIPADRRLRRERDVRAGDPARDRVTNRRREDPRPSAQIPRAAPGRRPAPPRVRSPW